MKCQIKWNRSQKPKKKSMKLMKSHKKMQKIRMLRKTTRILEMNLGNVRK